MDNLSSTRHIKQVLHRSLQVLGTVRECALVDYPQYANVGSHFLWLSEVLYLTEVLNVKIKYFSTLRDFSGNGMQEQIGNSPILLRSGYLGDFWDGIHGSKRRLIYEYIVERFQQNPIFIMPQSIHYRDPDKLKNAARIMNSHPDLTIFARESASYQFVSEHFSRCRVILAPDIVFHLAGLPGLNFRTEYKSSILYLRRSDWDSGTGFSPQHLGIADLVHNDWDVFWRVRKLSRNRVVRKLWQQHLAPPGEIASRYKWRFRYPYAKQLKQFSPSSVKLPSWNIIHSGLYQLQKHPLVITNRLHGHILSLLLDIPHILLPGPYNKMESFYNTWTHQIPSCRYVNEHRQVKKVAEELLQATQ
ncbi:MAG: polysaccharide pyruvyl transferase family protein [Pseudomonadota bacterium]